MIVLLYGIWTRNDKSIMLLMASGAGALVPAIVLLFATSSVCQYCKKKNNYLDI